MSRHEDDDAEISPSQVTSTFAQITGDEEKCYRGRIYSQTGQYGASDEHFETEPADYGSYDELWAALDGWITGYNFARDHDKTREVVWI